MIHVGVEGDLTEGDVLGRHGGVLADDGTFVGGVVIGGNRQLIAGFGLEHIGFGQHAAKRQLGIDQLMI